jgi:hypothetical protein
MARNYVGYGTAAPISVPGSAEEHFSRAVREVLALG